MISPYRKVQRLSVILLFACLLFSSGFLFAEEETESRKSNIQSVGGLLFELDEGVDVSRGPAGSVNIKTNRDYMQDKFQAIDRRFESIEYRLERLEAEIALQSTSGEEKKDDGRGSSSSDKRVLAT